MKGERVQLWKRRSHTSIVMPETDQSLLVYEREIEGTLLTVLFLSSMLSKLSLREGRKERREGRREGRGQKRKGKGRGMEKRGRKGKGNDGVVRRERSSGRRGVWCGGTS